MEITSLNTILKVMEMIRSPKRVPAGLRALQYLKVKGNIQKETKKQWPMSSKEKQCRVVLQKPRKSRVLKRRVSYAATY